MIGCRRVATAWAVGDAPERLSPERVDLANKFFHLIVSLQVDGGGDHKISTRGLAIDFKEGIRRLEGGIGVDYEVSNI